MSYPTATPRIASYIILRQGDKAAFVLRRHTSWMNDHYGFPSGKVEKNESYAKAAVREAKEETGVDIDEGDLRFIHVMHRKEGTDWVDVYFEATKWQGEPRNAEPHMHSELAWFDLHKLPDNTIPSVKFAIDQITKGSVYSEYGWD